MPADEGHEYSYSPDDTLSDSPYFSKSAMCLVDRILLVGSEELRNGLALNLSGLNEAKEARIMTVFDLVLLGA